MRKSFSIHLVSGSLAGEPCALNGASTVRGRGRQKRAKVPRWRPTLPNDG